MKKKNKRLISILILMLGLWHGTVPAQEKEATRKLKARSLELREDIIRVAEMAGGPAELLKKAEKALQSGDYQWAAQLADHLLYLDKNAVAPKQIKADAFEALAELMLNAPGRNHYLTEAQEIRKEIEKAPPDSNDR